MICCVQCDRGATLALPRLSPQAAAVCLIRDSWGLAGMQSRAPSYSLSHLPLRHILTDNGLSSVHSPFLITHVSCLCDLDPALCSETRSESGFSAPEGEWKCLDCRCSFAQLAPAFKITFLLMEEATQSQLNATMLVLSLGDIMLPWQCLAAFHRGFLHFR